MTTPVSWLLKDNGTLRVAFPETLDSLNASIFADLGARIRIETETRVVLDVSATQFLDSSGVGVLVAAYRAATEKGFAITVDGAHGQPKSLLITLQMDRAMVFT